MRSNLEPGILMRTLDAGAYGVICPMVNTREDAQKLVAEMRAGALATPGTGDQAWRERQ